jgi:flagellar hook-associated protein 3 FlgL
MNRITSTTSNRLMLADLNKANRAMVRAQERISSQKELSRASDGPASTLAALDHRGALRRSEQFQRNASDARSWLSTGDTALTSSVEELNHVRTLVISARSGASDPNSLAAIAAEIRTVRESMLSLANTEHLGRPIFAGTADGADAFDASGNYLGDQGLIQRPVAPSVTVQVNRTGTQVFGTSNANAIDGNVFQMLDALATAVEAGDLSTMSTGIVRLDTAVDRIESSQVELGARARQIDDVIARTEISDIERKQALSEVEDVDVAQALIDMSAKEFSYNAALSASAKVMQTSLLDFLR